MTQVSQVLRERAIGALVLFEDLGIRSQPQTTWNKHASRKADATVDLHVVVVATSMGNEANPGVPKTVFPQAAI